jgi:hypothetical protein
MWRASGEDVHRGSIGYRLRNAEGPRSLLALIELPRISRHLETSDEVGITCHSTRFRSDTIGLFRRQKRRPFTGEFLPHGLFALNALRESKIRPALFGWICSLLSNPTTHWIDVQIWNVLRSCRRTCRQQNDCGNTFQQHAHGQFPREVRTKFQLMPGLNRKQYLWTDCPLHVGKRRFTCALIASAVSCAGTRHALPDGVNRLG